MEHCLNEGRDGVFLWVRLAIEFNIDEEVLERRGMWWSWGCGGVSLEEFEKWFDVEVGWIVLKRETV